ncbi:APC family permease [Effusibacillus consociatus]|uniref:APC family permease n=1 Tax=Effusibacillus consociatus TaxID=1117041 RepID=A0ABV9PW93_9BACL
MSQKDGFVKVLGRLDVLVLAFGAMIGWGWVVLANGWVQSAGVLGSLIAFVIGAIMVLFVGLTYAELTSAMPETGGEHVYTHRAMGLRWSFIASWAIALGYISVVAFEAVALPTVLEYLVPNYKVGHMWTVAGWDVHASWVAVGMLGAFFITWLNYVGVKTAAVFQLICTVVLGLAGVLLITGSLVTSGTPSPAPLLVDGWSGIFAVMVMIPFLFVGFDVIPQAAEEINIPHKQIGNILILSVILAALFYIGVTYGVGHSLGAEELKNTKLASVDAMAAVFGSPLAAKILILGGIGGILTSWNAFMIGGSRILYAMADSNMIPKWVAVMHPKYKTPSNAILFIGVLSILAPLFGRKMLVWLVDAGGAGMAV